MLERYQRPFTAEERSKLAAELDRPPPSRIAMLRWLSVWFGVLVVGTLILSGIAVWVDGKSGWRIIVGGILAGVASIGCIVACYCSYAVVAGYRHHLCLAARITQERAPRVRAALQDGQASVCRVAATGVIVIEEWEDEQSALIYDLGDGRCLYLRGEEYYLDDETGMLNPPREFELVRAAVNDEWVGIFARDGKLTPELTITMEKMPDEFTWGDEPKSESILPGSSRDVLRGLGYPNAAG